VERVLREHRQEDVEVEAERAHHGDEDEDQPDLLVALRERDPFLQPGEERAGPFPPLDGVELLRPHQQKPGDDGDIARRVRREADAGADGGDEDAGERRPEDPGAVEEAGVEADCIGQLGRSDHAEGQGLARGSVQHLDEPHQRCDHVDVPGLCDARQCDDRNGRGKQHLCDLRADHRPPRVEPVDDDPGDEAEERERHELAEGEDADRDR
jgi:hypothetical protein